MHYKANRHYPQNAMINALKNELTVYVLVSFWYREANMTSQLLFAARSPVKTGIGRIRTLLTMESIT